MNAARIVASFAFVITAGCATAHQHSPSAVLGPATSGSLSPTTLTTTATTATTTPPPTTTAPVPAPTTHAGPTAAPAPAPAPASVTVSEAQNGGSVDVAVGGTVSLVLHSTYWSVDGSSNTSILSPNGPASVAPTPPGHGCVPGQGCGTVTETFHAARVGTASISAHRQSCGEAMACSPAQGAYVVTIRIR